MVCIKMKRDAADTTWLTVNNPDDLFKHVDDASDFDLDIFHDRFHAFKILPLLPVPVSCFAEFSDDDDDKESEESDV